jgi:hypothetical protein
MTGPCNPCTRNRGFNRLRGKLEVGLRIAPRVGVLRELAISLTLGCVFVAFAAFLSTSAAVADVDAVGRLTPVEPTLRSRPVGGVRPLVNSEHDGLYECSTADEYSPLHAEAFGLVIGNCKAGWKFEVVDYGGPSGGHYSYGGHNSNLRSCGWIESNYKPEKPEKSSDTACDDGKAVSTEPESVYLERKNSGAEDGYYVVNTEPCKEYANYEPWSSKNVEKEQVGTIAAYEESTAGKSLPAIKWRYITKSASTDGTGKYVMVRVENRKVSEGQINWVFVPRSCLPASLPESEGALLPPAPSATTGGYSSVTYNSAVLSGSVNPNGVETHYYIEWGRESSKPYEEFAPTPYPGEDLGSGTSSINRSVTATGLLPDTTYYYRIIAKSATGTAEGGLGAFTTSPVVFPREVDLPSRSVLHAPGSSSESAFYVGASGQLYSDFYNGSKWSSLEIPSEGGEQAAANAAPTVIPEEPGGVDQWVYYVGASGQIYTDSYNGSKWSSFEIPSEGGEQAAANAAPTAIRDAENGDQWVYYVGASGQIYTDSYNGSKWSSFEIPSGGEQAAANASPTVVQGGVDQFVYYVGANGQIYCDIYTGSSWSNVEIPSGGGEQAAANASPSLVVEAGGADQWVYYVGASGQMYTDSFNAASWSNAEIPSKGGVQIAANVSPTGIRSGAEQWVYYVGTSGQLYRDVFGGTSWSNGEVFAEGEPAELPAI